MYKNTDSLKILIFLNLIDTDVNSVVNSVVLLQNGIIERKDVLKYYYKLFTKYWRWPGHDRSEYVQLSVGYQNDDSGVTIDLKIIRKIIALIRFAYKRSVYYEHGTRMQTEKYNQH